MSKVLAVCDSAMFTAETARSIFWYLLSRMSLTNLTLSAHMVMVRLAAAGGEQVTIFQFRVHAIIFILRDQNFKKVEEFHP